MHPSIVQQLSRERTAELRREAERHRLVRAAHPPTGGRGPVRRRVGGVVVAFGRRLQGPVTEPAAR